MLNSAGVQAVSAILSIFAVIIVSLIGNHQSSKQQKNIEAKNKETSLKVLARCKNYYETTLDAVSELGFVKYSPRIMQLGKLDVPSELLLLYLSPKQYDAMLNLTIRIDNLRYYLSGNSQPSDYTDYEAEKKVCIDELNKMINLLET